MAWTLCVEMHFVKLRVTSLGIEANLGDAEPGNDSAMTVASLLPGGLGTRGTMIETDLYSVESDPT